MTAGTRASGWGSSSTCGFSRRAGSRVAIRTGVRALATDQVAQSTLAWLNLRYYRGFLMNALAFVDTADYASSNSQGSLMNRLAMAVTVFLLATPAVSQAAGFYLYEIGTPSVGLASAGYTTRAGDAETLFTNPAGMALLEKHEFLAGVQLLYGNFTFSPGPGTTPSGGNGGNAVGVLPGGSLFFVADVAPKVRVGLGVAQYFGSALQYDPGWVGRYYGQKGLLLGVSFLPTASYRITDWLSVGGGLNLMWGIKRATIAVNNILPSLADGQVETNSDTFGIGGNLGILVEPVKGTRVGFTWLSQVYLPFSSTPAWSGLGPGLELALRQTGLLGAKIDLGMTLPNRLMLGVRQEIGPEWAVMADLGWESWSQYGEVEVSVNTPNPTSLTTSIPYKNTWHVAAGAQWKAVPNGPSPADSPSTARSWTTPTAPCSPPSAPRGDSPWARSGRSRTPCNSGSPTPSSWAETCRSPRAAARSPGRSRGSTPAPT